MVIKHISLAHEIHGSLKWCITIVLVSAWQQVLSTHDHRYRLQSRHSFHGLIKELLSRKVKAKYEYEQEPWMCLYGIVFFPFPLIKALILFSFSDQKESLTEGPMNWCQSLVVVTWIPWWVWFKVVPTSGRTTAGKTKSEEQSGTLKRRLNGAKKIWPSGKRM